MVLAHMMRDFHALASSSRQSLSFFLLWLLGSVLLIQSHQKLASLLSFLLACLEMAGIAFRPFCLLLALFHRLGSLTHKLKQQLHRLSFLNHHEDFMFVFLLICRSRLSQSGHFLLCYGSLLDLKFGNY